MQQRHPYHLVTPSPWPFITSITAFLIPLGAVQYMHFYTYGLVFLAFGLIGTIATMSIWWRDVIREATFEGMHTRIVQRGLRLGFVLFIVSEIMFFFAFFWAFFHSSLAPTIQIGSIWPPAGIEVFNPFGIPFYNTYILLLSGVTITITHHAIINGNARTAKLNFLKTILLACMFTSLQVFEYLEAPFTIADGIYGSTFYMATGFHGMHVIIGTIFIAVCFVRLVFSHFTKQHHIGFEAATWYWHFVDVVWLFLFVSIYWWGSILHGK
jgi:heme/copper-type cytochrome/quinol oxidase subunit 3